MTRQMECLENAIGHVTKLLLLTENGEEKEIIKLVNCLIALSDEYTTVKLNTKIDEE